MRPVWNESPLTQEELDSIKDPQTRQGCMDNPGFCRGYYVNNDEPTPTGGDITSPGGDTSSSGATTTVTVSYTTPTIQVDANPNIYDIGPGQDIPVQSEPGSVIRAIDVNGDLHNIGLYDSQGNLVERVDVLGRPHFGIEPPHVEPYSWSEYEGGWGYGKLPVRPTNPSEN